MNTNAQNRLSILTRHILSSKLNTLINHTQKSSLAKPSTLHHLSDYIIIAPEVQQALQNNDPVVALESTIISHGMPYPQNVHTAQLVEQQIRRHGAIPGMFIVTMLIRDKQLLRSWMEKLELACH